MFWDVYKWSCWLIFISFNDVSATLINRASGAFQDTSSWANPGGAHLLITLVYFKDSGVVGRLGMLCLFDFHVF